MTFSLVALDGDTGAFGMVVCSSSPAVSSRCAHLRARVGAVASQNVTNPALGPLGLDALETTHDANAALQLALAGERFPEHRQLIVLDGQGRTAVHSGSKSLGVHSSAQGDGAAAAGNMLHDPNVVRSLLSGYLTSTASTFEGRLLDGLLSAGTAGGEAGPVYSAGLKVVEDVSWPTTDLRVDWHPDPVNELRQLWIVWSEQKSDYRTRGIDPTKAPSYGVPGDE